MVDDAYLIESLCTDYGDSEVLRSHECHKVSMRRNSQRIWAIFTTYSDESFGNCYHYNNNRNNSSNNIIAQQE